MNACRTLTAHNSKQDKTIHHNKDADFVRRVLSSFDTFTSSEMEVILGKLEPANRIHILTEHVVFHLPEGALRRISAFAQRYAMKLLSSQTSAWWSVTVHCPDSGHSRPTEKSRACWPSLLRLRSMRCS